MSEQGKGRLPASGVRGATREMNRTAIRPYWSIYAQVYKSYLFLRKHHNSEKRAFAQRVISMLDACHIVYLSTEQVDAIPTECGIGVPRQARRVEAEALLRMRPPFQPTFLAVGGTVDRPTAGDGPLYAALMDGTTVIPFHWFPDASSVKVMSLGIAEMNGPEGLDFTVVGQDELIHNPITDGESAFDMVGELTTGGAVKAYRALSLLESANVDVEPVPSAPRGHRAGGRPCYEVVVRQRRTRPAAPSDEPGAIDWSHRWETRGHFKHFTRGRIFEGNSERRVAMPDGTPCVRIWCPPFVKGPDDKPLIPKARVVA